MTSIAAVPSLSSHDRTYGLVWPTAIALGASFVLLMTLSMTGRLDHDEHQFITSAVLLARRGLLPYRDYPYFHAPYLLFIYAGIFSVCDHLLLAARLICTLCSFGIVATLYFMALREFRFHSPRVRLAVATGVMLLALANPIFTATSGRSWNHDVPVFLMLLSLLAIERSVKRGVNGGAKWGVQWGGIILATLSGALMGIATGVRLTFAPATLAFLALPFITPGMTVRQRLSIGFGYCAGVIIALSPALRLLAAAPRQFMFGNFGYPTLNTAIRISTGYTKSMTLLGKLGFLFSDVLDAPANFAIVALLLMTVYMLRRAHIRLSDCRRARVGFLVIVLCALCIGSFAPTPLFRVYFFAPLPIVFLLVLVLAEPLCIHLSLANRWMRCGAVAVALSLPMAVVEYKGFVHLFSPAAWVPLRVHAVGKELAAALEPHTAVLTVSPLFALEGNEDVFEQFATGPFALRVVPLVSEDDETQFKFLDDDDLRGAFLARSPRAVLTGAEPGLDATVLTALAGLDLKPRTLSNGCIVWTSSASK